MSDTLKGLKGKRDALVSEMRAAVEEADTRDGGATAEDDAKVRKYDEDIAALDERMAGYVSALKRADDIDPDVRAALDAEDAPAPKERDNTPTDEARLRDVFTGKTRSAAFKPAKRDLTVGSATAGGNLVPTSFYNQLVDHLIETSGVLQAGPTFLQTSSGEKIEVPVTTSHSTAARTNEAAAISESDPAFAQRELDTYKYALLLQVSRELAEDEDAMLQSYIAMQGGRAVGEAWGADLVVGTGSSQPQGVATAATTGVTGAGTAPTFDELIDLFHSVIAPYRASQSCAWLMEDLTVAGIRKLKDSNDQYLWQPGLTVGEPDRILGKPVYVDHNVAANGNSAKSVLFGDFSRYMVRQVNEIEVATSSDYAFNQDLITYRVLVRGGGVMTDQTGAIKAFVGVAA